MALCRFTLVYIFSGPGTGAGVGVYADAEVGIRETAEVRTEVPLLLVGALLALWRVQGPTI